MPAGKKKLDDNLHWYKDAIIYELHIKAFCDSNANGIGDFNGLLTKLDYLQNLGVTAIWLLPFYPSPGRDDGYDISDYYSINPSYGEIRHFKKFLSEAHKRNLKVITELVINHTSDQHPWFQRARKAPIGSPERDYYVWTDNPHQYREVRIIFQDFEKSNWTWDPVAKQYYWHRFFHHQPDLNYDNPLVQEEVFKMLDYWCEMGVDGFRLDAVPYLFEREGTNCENLPETHAFLKKLRKHVDQNYPGTLLLAEANMWPEDSASYFGNGDECQMNYHFPVMPRMFMALQMEDRYPITDIFDQTPEIPETCQWAMFLRNHDELTLEMVTDEERDYMYKVYVKDPKARINLGIRHRLAPLMGNDRKKIELLNYLLFSLPGTPVVYYGDEIGMGDNFYLGDRDGVRTPMQWSADRNAGFSNCESYKLYLPVILDPEYHYEAVNADIQSKNPSSLLMWMRRLINTRKHYKAFSRGNMKFMNTDNSKVLTFTRTYQDQTILVVANLSRYAQPVELDLREYKGHVPVEAFGKNKFPKIHADEPYLFMLGAHECHWFLLEKTESLLEQKKDLHILKLNEWEDILSRQSMIELEEYILPEYLMQVRWFGGKSRSMRSLKVIDHILLQVKKENVFLLLIEVSYESGLPDIYQLPLSFCVRQSAEELREAYPKSVICKINIGGRDGVLFDAIYGHDLQNCIVQKMINNDILDLKDSEIHFTSNNLLKDFYKNNEPIKSKMMSGEQSNTALTYNNKFFLKLYRKVDIAINPDLELTHFLSHNTNFKNIPPFVGTVEWKYKNGTMVLGMMQEMVENNGDAWTYMQDTLKSYNEKLLMRDKPMLFPELKGSLVNPVKYEDIPENAKEIIDVTVAERARLLGIRTGEMHLALASGTELPNFAPEEFSLHYQRSLFSSFQSLVRVTFQNQVRNIRKLPLHLREEVKDILAMKGDILHVLKRIYNRKLGAVKIRIHGDYHLGQVLVTGKDFVILDFEGEPARSYSERRLKRSPLRDVAGMIRSFHYAAYSSLLLNDHLRKKEVAKLMPYAELWYHYMSGFFMKAYLETVKDTGFIPDEKEDLEVMMQTYILEKAIYELNYELNNRPDWVLIPLRSIKSIMEKQSLPEPKKRELKHAS
jgi:maltose alpha-D-glucosyltransferase/alpha-amylase